MKRRHLIASMAALPAASFAATGHIRIGFQKGGVLLLPMHRRARFGAVPVTEAIAADQQRVADAFHAQGLIPRPIKVRDNFWFG